MKLWIGAHLLATLIFSVATNKARGVAIPISDPGFDLYIAGTTTLVPDGRLAGSPTEGAGGGPAEDVPILVFDTFEIAPEGEGKGDVPAGWTASGVKPGGSAPATGRVRIDSAFRSPSGSMAVINSNHDENGPGMFSQTLTGFPVQTHTLYTATVEVSDLDITGRGPFMAPDDNVVLGSREMILLSLSVGSIDLGGELEFTDITPGGAFNADGTSVSGGKSLLTLTLSTGAVVPAGDLTISFSAAGASEPHHGFVPSAQTFFDNVTLDATPMSIGVPGDYNNNGTVDAADYTVWRDGGLLQNEVDTLGTLDQSDYDAWKAHFGNSSGNGAGSIAAVPEPASIWMLCVVLFCVAIGCRRATRVG